IPLGVMAECGYCGHVKALADDHVAVMFQAAGGCSLDCIALLLRYGGSGNVPGGAGLLPIHKAAYEGHRFGSSTVHSAVDSQNQCLELVIENCLDVNTLLSEHITSNTYDDRRETALSMELLLLSHGYNVEMCLDFMCQGIFGNSFVWPAPELEPFPSWTTSSINNKLKIHTFLASLHLALFLSQIETLWFIVLN
uniref:Uncharacterized protein n=1 Tax=Serinus canaria TaxID=9135 RepID=A0A8C9U6L0_SERCA